MVYVFTRAFGLIPWLLPQHRSISGLVCKT